MYLQEKRSQSHLEEVPEDSELNATGDPSSTMMIQHERDKERDDRVGAAALNRSRSINRQRLVAHSTAMESIQAESEPIDEEDDVPYGFFLLLSRACFASFTGFLLDLVVFRPGTPREKDCYCLLVS